MAKRQRYSVKESGHWLRPRNRHSSSTADCSSAGEPRCSYMYGGLSDLRRETYSCKSPLKHFTPKTESTNCSKLTSHDTKSKDSATIGEFSTTPGSPAVVKTNPLLSREERLVDRSSGENAPEDPVFYGQRTKIRRTKEQEMISAILELAEYGKKRNRIKAKCSSLLDKVRRTGGAGRGRRKKRGDGPFILRPRPLKSHNTN